MKIISILSTLTLFASCAKAYNSVSPEEFEKFITDNNAQILDVRTLQEYSDGHIPGSILIDVKLQNFNKLADEKLTKNTPVAVYCRSGKRSITACDILSKEGYSVVNLESGFNGWQQSGKDISTKDMTSVYEFIKKCGHYFIATVDGDQPRVRPFGTINIFEGKLYIQTGHVKRTAKQINQNPKVELCAFDGEQWVRLNGILVEDNRIEAKKSMLDAYPNLRTIYDENDNNTAVYYFTHATAYLSSFKNKEEIVKF